MKRACAVALLGVLFSAASVTNAFGCSYDEGTLFPSNYDRVKEAESIVLADALSLDTKRPGDADPLSYFYFMPKLTVRTVETIKGNFSGGTLPVSPVSSCSGYDFSDAVGQRVPVGVQRDETGGACRTLVCLVHQLYALSL